MEPMKEETGTSDEKTADPGREKMQRHLPKKGKGKAKRNYAAKSSPTDCLQVDMPDAAGNTPKASTSTRRTPEEPIRGGIDKPHSIDQPIDDIHLKNVATVMCEELPSSSSKKSTKTSDANSKLSIAQLLMDDDDDDDFFFKTEEVEVGGREGSVEVDAKVGKLEPQRSDDHPIENVRDGHKVDERIAAKMLATSVKDDKPEVLVITKEPAQSVQPKTEWAEVVNINQPVSDFHKKVPVMAKTWAFELDVFQKQAIIHLEQHENVFVAAHTSAGKTVVAEYAIALSMRHMTRTIYTSPIKALSNQKYRDFKETFEDVGLLTGDIQINPSASCLIMTTEILRSMLYNGSDTIRDLEWVIFDEVHYINDAERGVVWEEVLIMLPPQVNIVLLSATVPNTLQFADWIGRTKQKKIFVISTPKRPVPLEHHLYIEAAPKGQEKLFLLINQDAKLNTAGYTAALTARSSSSKAAKRQQYGSKMPRTALGIHQEKNLYVDVVNVLKKRDKLPVVVFTFSRYRCDRNARSLFSLDLTTATEKNRITEFVRRCVDRLTESDRDLPQVRAIQDLLLQGIGVHHSGILPILKEVVELLFQQGHVKLLFATETFAMGVNMPARTVVFDAIQKHDGTQTRNLTAAEYIQMAGRAGRRGLDQTGLVIVLCKDDIPELSDLNAMMMGKPALLESQFRLTYSMILNLLSVDGLTVEDMMKRSFSEADNQKRIPVLQMQVNELNRKVASLKGVDCEICSSTLEDYYGACDSYVLECTEIREIVFKSPTALAPGRIVLIVVATKSARPRFAAVLKETKQASSASDLTSKRSVFTVLTTRNVEEEEQDEKSVDTAQDDWPHYLNAHEYLVAVPDATHHKFVTQCESDDILLITARMLRADTGRVLKDWEKRQIPRFKDDQPSESFLSATQELISFAQQCHDERYEDIAFDPFKDRALKDVIDLHDKIPHSKNIRQYLRQSPCINCVHFEEHFHHVYRARKLKERLRSKQLMLRKSLVLQPEYESRVEVLKELTYVDGRATVTLKGRVARRIGSNELIITELILNNVFTEMEPAEIAALLSCMVFQEKRCSEANLNAVLKKGVEDIMENVKRIARVQREKGLKDEHYEKQFNFNLAEVVYEWAKGTSFTDIMQLTDVQEGVIVRCIQRLDEILRDVKEAAKTVGNPVLQSKMDEASQAIKRDIVFAASLYIH